MTAARKCIATFSLFSLLATTSLFWDTFRILAVGGPSSIAVISADSEQGDNGWYTGGVTVTITATPNGTPVKSITYWLDSGPQTTVNVAQTTAVFSENGTHVLSFYATDTSNVQGPTGTINFKIDTISPVNWHNIFQTRNGNDHTFRFTGDVDDATSGLDPTRVYMQYNIDDTGATWGYHSNLTSCNSQWIADEWYPVTSYFTAGAKTVTFSTPPVDYCNSSGTGCDFMKIRIYDMAGNYSDKKICLGGPWVQTTNGPVYSVSNISMQADAPQPNATYVVGTGGTTINSFASSNNQYLLNYANSSKLTSINYAGLNNKLGATAVTMTSGSLPITSGVYKYNGSYTITSANIPAGFTTTKNFATIILVSGTVTINTNINTDPSSVLVLVASGGINVDRSVASLKGIFITSGLFDTSYNGNSNVQLVVTGGAFAEGGFDLARTLGTTTNKTTPAEKFVMQPGIFMNSKLASILSGTATYSWNEVTP